MKVQSERGYGWGIYIRLTCWTVIMNGHTFVIYRGVNTQKWHAEYRQNIWLRQGVAIRS